MMAVEVEDLSIELGGAAVLDRVSFRVGQGEIFGLVGESGSGKSTVLRCIAGLYRHWTGMISVNGAELQRTITPARSRQIQMVFQDPYGSLHPKQTVDTQLMEVMRVHRLDEREARVVRALGLVGLDESFRFRYPHQLSGGQRQRVAIARALLVEPEILLLDEPTSALDVSVQAEVLNLLKDLQERSKLTYIIVSHDLAVINHMCSRFSVMQHGRIVETLSARSIVDPQAQLDTYTRILVQSSKGYNRALAASLREME